MRMSNSWYCLDIEHFVIEDVDSLVHQIDVSLI